ncbi:predicted protein [Plenodomus lingam JN3]|uniref:Predicted protein n=1 Tax=Leptosphaeria maculans (strain JN3 / isolate v23.1.3 / race Av1-4-5-6-7-8) TaxID=985895 RepID=E4ZWN0_LEPMJ|nr:predicted protein [Plenodomus lingam JN3]CBX96006.1 predicted protein [Plenodomus lingam JN3]
MNLLLRAAISRRLCYWPTDHATSSIWILNATTLHKRSFVAYNFGYFTEVPQEYKS